MTVKSVNLPLTLDKPFIMETEKPNRGMISVDRILPDRINLRGADGAEKQ